MISILPANQIDQLEAERVRPITKKLDICHSTATVDGYYAAVRRAIPVMYERFDEPLSLQDMADAAVLSPYHFNRVFRKLTGITPCQFLCAIRIKAAVRLLLTTQLSSTDICFAVGYNSLGTFTSRFTELVGLPPTRLRDLAVESVTLPEPPANRCDNLNGASNVAISGWVSTDDQTIAMIFVGLFPTAIPQGSPIRCALLAGPGNFSISQVPDGGYYVCAAGLPRMTDPLDYLMPEHAFLQVGISSGPVMIVEGRAQIHPTILLRAIQVTDPPILSAIPLMLNNYADLSN